MTKNIKKGTLRSQHCATELDLASEMAGCRALLHCQAGRDLNTQLVGSAHPAGIPALLCHRVLASCQYTASRNELAARSDHYRPAGLNLESITMHEPLCAVWRTYKQETWALECCTSNIRSVFLWRSRSPWMFSDFSAITGIVLSSLQVRSSTKICTMDISHYCY